MAVSSTTRRSDYVGNGSTVEFAVGFQVLLESHLAVYLTDPTDLESPELQVLGTDYTVSGTLMSGLGVVTFVTPPTDTYLVTILRNVPYTQLVGYDDYDNFPATTHEKAIDQLTMGLQQVDEKVSRCPMMPEGIESEGLQFPTGEVNAAIVWNGDGDALTNGPTTSEISNAQSYATSASSSASSASSSAATATTARNEAVAAAASVNLPALATATEGELVSVNAAKDGYDLAGVIKDNIAQIPDANIFGKAQTYGTAELTISSGVVTWDMQADPCAVIELTENVTTFTMSNMAAGGQYELTIIQDATGSRTFAWPSTLLWPGGEEVTVTADANAEDVFSFSAREFSSTIKTRVVGVQALATA